MANSMENTVKEVSLLEKKVKIDFTTSRTKHDRILRIDGTKFYVNSMLLSMCSDFFVGLFNSSFKEKDQNEIALKDVSPKDFEHFLCIIYPTDLIITTKNEGGLFALFDRFLTPFARKKDKKDKERYVLEKNLFIDFNDSSTFHDRVLLIQGEQFYVNSMLLAMCSKYFDHLFTSNDKTEIELEDVPTKDFENFLRILYPMDFKITGENVRGLFILADRFLAPIPWRKCIEFIEDPKNGISLYDLLDWSKFVTSDSFKAKVANQVDKKLSVSKTKETVVFFLNVCKEFPFLSMERKAGSALFKLFQDEPQDIQTAEKYLKIANDHQLNGLKNDVMQWLIPLSEGKCMDEQLELLNLARNFDMMDLTNKANAELVKLFLAEPEKTKIAEIFLTIATEYQLIGLMVNIVYYLENIIDGKSVDELLEFLVLAKKFDLACLTTAIGHELVKSFQGESENKKLVQKFLTIAKDYQLETLEMHIQENLIERFDTSVNSFRNNIHFLLEIAFVNCLDFLENHVRDWPFYRGYNYEDLKNAVDEQLAKRYNNGSDFHLVEGALKYNLTCTKGTLERYLQLSTLKTLKRNKQVKVMIESNEKVATFIRRGLARNADNEKLIEHFF